MTAIVQPSVTLSGRVIMPQLGLGVWQTPADETATVVASAVDAGYRAVDTAAIYRNEDGVGAGLSSDPDIFLTTKLWNADHGHDATLRAFDASTKRLGRDVIDLYLIHWPVPANNLYIESWQAMIRLREEGRIRAIGVSNFNPDHIERLIAETGETPAINQIELHPRFQRRDLRAWHADRGIVTQSWSPLGQGEMLTDPVIGAIAARVGKTPAQVIIRWHLDSGLVVIPKSVRAQRLRENIDVFDFTLSAEDIDRIDALDRADGRMGPDPVAMSF